MRILVCSIEAPLPPVNGLRLHLSALVDGLAARHEVQTLALLAGDQRAESAAVSGLRTVPMPRRTRVGVLGSYAGSLLHRRPAGADRAAKILRDALDEELLTFRPDVVHVTSGRLAGLGRHAASRPAVLAALDAWHVNVAAETEAARGLHRALLRVQGALVRRFEAHEFRRFARVVVVSEEDKAALVELDPTLPVTVIPNGVDTGFFSPGADDAPAPERIAFTGVMSYTPNVDAAEYLARRVFPLVRQTRPRAQLALVGRDPHPRVRALATIEGVEVTGEVADIRPWLWESRVYACTMVSGTGIKNKLLEAMASGLPCVATPLALRGIDLTPGVHVLVGEREEELAVHLAGLLEDDEAARELGNAGREYAVAHHSWDEVVRRYERVYEEVLAERGA